MPVREVCELAAGSRTQFGLSLTNSNRMLGPSSVSLLTSMRRRSSAGKDNCAWMRSARARSGRVPPGQVGQCRVRDLDRRPQRAANAQGAAQAQGSSRRPLHSRDDLRLVIVRVQKSDGNAQGCHG